MSITHGADGNYNASTATATITVNPAVPIITSGTTANGTVGSSFTYQITASNSPTSYAATNLAGTGLSINTSTGLISGTPTSVGTITSSLSAANGGGTSTPVTLTIAVGAAPPQADDNTHNQLNIHLPN